MKIPGFSFEIVGFFVYKIIEQNVKFGIEISFLFVYNDY